MKNEPGRLSRAARVFFPVFALASVAALAYVLEQPPVYVARARVQVALPAEKQGDAPSVLAQSVQTLTGNAMLESVWTRMGGSGNVGASALRGMLSAEPVAGASAIELRAEGADREALPRILNTWIAAWRESDGGPESSAGKALDEARAAAERLKQEVETRRGELEQFRVKTGITPETAAGEQPGAARLKELDDAFTQAVGREADSETRLKTLKESAAAGKALPGTETPAAGALEKQVSAVRLGIKNLEQDYTPLYLAHDPRYNSLRSELARLEEQIEQEKQASARQALQKAEEESAGARQAASRAREELAAAKQVAEEHAARVAEHEALTGDLAKLEEAHAAARERLAQLDKGREAGPRLTVLSEPAVPDRPDRPTYWRDSLLGVTGAAALGLIAAWIAGLRRREPVSPPGPRPERPSAMPDAAAGLPAMDGQFPRELSGSEVHALWRAAAPDGRIVVAGLLAGLSLEELAALRYEHVDFVACYVRVPGISGRSCTLRDPLRRLLVERRAAQAGHAPLADARGEPLAAAGIEGLIARNAHEAGLANAAGITSEILRHTYFAYLVRQGARFAEIGEFIGRLSPAAHREYTLLAPPGAGRPMEEIDPVFPALRELR